MYVYDASRGATQAELFHTRCWVPNKIHDRNRHHSFGVYLVYISSTIAFIKGNPLRALFSRKCTSGLDCTGRTYFVKGADGAQEYPTENIH